MRKTIIVGATVLAAVVAGTMFLGDDSSEDAAPPTAAAISSTQRQQATESRPAVPGAEREPLSQSGVVAQPGSTDPNPLPADPRLSALAVSPDNGLIKFVAAPDGKVIKEIDQDPASLGFGKPSREYLYAGDKVVGLTAYRYMSDHVEVATTTVTYKPDGSVDQFLESTSYQRKK